MGLSIRYRYMGSFWRLHSRGMESALFMKQRVLHGLVSHFIIFLQ